MNCRCALRFAAIVGLLVTTRWKTTPGVRGLSQARLKLVQTTQIVLRNLLGLLGIGAPERM